MSEQRHDDSPVLQMLSVSKRYPGTLAVDRVDFDVRPGEVHALMGENGAGKTTLVKLLAGAFNDYDGRVVLAGESIALRTPARARAAGIEMIHQELNLAGALSIAENLLAGRLPRRAGLLLDRDALRRLSRQYLARVDLAHLDPDLPVERLSQHEAQLVEIAKTLSARPRVLIMDEPTSALSRAETENLFSIIAQLKKRGLAIVYVSHHLHEVFRVADRVSVLRDGRKIATRALDTITPELIVEMMVGHKIESRPRAVTAARQSELFEARRLTRIGFFHDLSFTVGHGEIVGLGGLAGSGRTELARSICCLDPLDHGRLFLEGQEILPRSMRDCLRLGIGYLTEDRNKLGLDLNQSAQFNVLTPLTARRWRLPGRRVGLELFHRLARRLRLSPPDPQQLTVEYSGGNQQKVLLAKWLAVQPKLLILDEPTRGVDIAAKETIHDAFLELARQGTGILLISSDLPELVSLADRVLVLRQGRITRELQSGCLDEDTVLLAANGDDGEAAI